MGACCFRKTKKLMKTATQILTILSTTFALSIRADGQSYSLQFDTTTATGWTVTADGLYGVTPYEVVNEISVTSTGNGSGAFLPGGNLATFDGFWLADYSFYLPANATGISLSYQNFYADDRAVLTLNGNIIGATGIPYFGQLNEVGSMVLQDGGPVEQFSSFSGPDGSVAGTVTTGFKLGGLNTIEAIINNTDTGVFGSDTDLTPSDGTLLGLSGTISFNAVPEPCSIVMFSCGLFGLAALCRQPRTK